jgi:hypothetical protein
VDFPIVFDGGKGDEIKKVLVSCAGDGSCGTIARIVGTDDQHSFGTYSCVCAVSDSTNQKVGISCEIMVDQKSVKFKQGGVSAIITALMPDGESAVFTSSPMIDLDGLKAKGEG